MESVSFAWQLTGTGWATITLGLGSDSVVMTASYLHDSLRDVLSALAAIEDGTREVTAVLMDEPGEHHVILRRVDDATVEVEVRWFDDWASWGMHAPTDFSVVAARRVRWPTFRGQVVDAFERLLLEHGEEGYRQKWHLAGFPVDELRRLAGRT